MPSFLTHTTPTPLGCKRKCRRFAARRLGGRYRSSITKSSSASFEKSVTSSSASASFETFAGNPPGDSAEGKSAAAAAAVASAKSPPPSPSAVSFRRFKSRSSRAAAVAAASSARFLSLSSRAATTAAAAAAAASRARFSLSASASTRASSSSSARLIAAGKSTSSNCFFNAAAFSEYFAFSSADRLFQPAPSALPISEMFRAHSGGCCASKTGRASLA